MRPRREPLRRDIPAHLWAFRSEDWAGTQLDRWYAWHRARRAHYVATPDAWPDVVTLLADAYAVRGSLLGTTKHRSR